MSHTTSRRRSAAALGATALLATVLAAPAMASQDPGTGGSGTTSQAPNGIDRNRQLGGFTYSTEVSTLPQQPAAQEPSTRIVFRDNDAVEYLQVGAGVLAGIVLAGAAAAVISRRNHRGLTPA
jgi:hypothetical protein